MKDDTHDDSHDDSRDGRYDEASESDRLLARAVAGDAAALAEVRARSAQDPALLEELALWQADELRLARAARALDAAADRVEIPAPARRLSSGVGWVLAAVLAVAFAGQQFVAGRGTAGPSSQGPSVAGIGGGFSSADQAFEAYLAKARAEGLVEGEVAPPTLLRSRELGDGRGFEVVIVRQVVERRVTPEVYRIAPMGETGRPRAIVIRPRTDAIQ